MERVSSPINKLRNEHSTIIKELTNFEKCLVRVGKNLDAVERFLNLFDSKIYYIIKLEKNILFPYLSQYIEKDGPLFVMNYTHEIIENEFERLRNALSKKDMYNIHMSEIYHWFTTSGQSSLFCHRWWYISEHAQKQ